MGKGSITRDRKCLQLKEKGRGFPVTGIMHMWGRAYGARGFIALSEDPEGEKHIKLSIAQTGKRASKMEALLRGGIYGGLEGVFRWGTLSKMWGSNPKPSQICIKGGGFKSALLGGTHEAGSQYDFRRRRSSLAREGHLERVQVGPR